MSLGYTGRCKLLMEDESLVVYSYAGENWNDNGKSKPGDSALQDGMFTIDKTHTIKDVADGLNSGAITINRECKNAFRKPDVPCDYIAWRLLVHILDCYKKNGYFPEKDAFIQ